MRGTLSEVTAIARAVLHALELADEDIRRWAGSLTDVDLNSHPFGITPVAFHIRHISRSLDRLLTYAEGRQLSGKQLALLKSEADEGATRHEIFEEFEGSLKNNANRVRALASADMSEKREVGSKKLPTTVGGLLVHLAEHTQRHVGQAVTTAKIVVAQRKPAEMAVSPDPMKQA